MRCRARALIIRELETSKRDGMIAEYLVCWSEADEKRPSIAIWSQRWPAHILRDLIAGRLCGTPGACITVIDEPPPVLVSRRFRRGAAGGRARLVKSGLGQPRPLQ